MFDAKDILFCIALSLVFWAVVAHFMGNDVAKVGLLFPFPP